MAIDPSIPLGVKLYSYLDDEARRQQIANARLARQQAQLEAQDKQTERDAYGKIFSGGMDQSGHLQRPNGQTLGDLARVNPEAATKVLGYFNGLDEQARKVEEAKWKAATPLLVRAKQLPYEQRRALIQSAAPVLMANGWTPQELQSFDPTDQNVDAMSSAAMTVDQVINNNKIDWHPIGENGSFATDNLGNPVGSGNPFAPQAPSQPKQPSSVGDVFGALIQQESGGQAGIKGQHTRYGVPLGKTQMLPGTAKEMAGKLGLPWRPEMLTGTSPEASQYQEALGKAYFDEGLSKYGGNVEQALKYYHGGPDESKWGPKTRTYAKAILARVKAKANPQDVRAKAQAAIARGADPEAVRQRAAALGVTL